MNILCISNNNNFVFYFWVIVLDSNHIRLTNKELISDDHFAYYSLSGYFVAWEYILSHKK